MATTWNPSDKGSGFVTLSGGNLTATITTGHADGVRATASLGSGKWYWEITLTDAHAVAGVANSVPTLVSDGLSGTGILNVRASDGQIFHSGGLVGTLAAMTSGDVLSIAVDTAAGTVAFRKNNGTAVTISGANVPTGSLFPDAYGDGSASVFTANFGAQALVYTPPAGYTAIDAIVDRTGTSAATRENITAAGAGITSAGLSSATRQNIVAAGTGINSSGQSAQTLQGITAAGATLPVFASAQVLQAIVVGPALPILNSTQTLLGIAAAGAGFFYQGSFLPAIIAAGAGSESQTGTSSQALQSIKATGSTALAGVSQVTLGTIVVGSQGVEGMVGSSVAVRQPLVAFGAGGFFAVGRSAVALPAIIASSRGYLGTGASFSAVVMHTESQALWTYTNFVFNSFAKFNGQILAGSDSGLFQLAGDNDNGVAIDASARMGTTDFNTSHLKRVERVYMGYRSAGEMILRVRTDETNVRDYLVPRTRFAGLHGNHVKLGRGLDARYWQFEVRNRNGSDFSLNMLECKPVVLKRRVGRDDA